MTVGVCYRVPAADAARVLDNLDFREKGGYTRAVVEVQSLDGSRAVQALVYTANSQNPLFLGSAAVADSVALAARIAKAKGPSGPNTEYLFKIADYLRKVECADPHCHVRELEQRIKSTTG